MSDWEVASFEDEEADMMDFGRSVEVPPYGHLHPFCKGKLLWSPEASHWIFVLLALAGGTLLFSLLWGSLRFTDPNILPNRWMTQFPDVVVVLLTLVCAALLLLTSLTNPGILPKNKFPRSISTPAAKEYCATLPYCRTCHIYRPSQVGHCRRCNNCVAQFDHHCRLLGCCIGELNRRYFLLFSFSIAVYNMFISVCLGYFLVVVFPKENILRYIIFTIGFAITAVLSLILTGYLMHNFRLIRMGLLHREYMKGAAPRNSGRPNTFGSLLLLLLFPKKESGLSHTMPPSIAPPLNYSFKHEWMS
ncbi:hypothetical protein JKF63_06652 [Porcisia hertigi]|uniref:Palmitoyltransferase n=1 Tax=Porcisia hertigi TaxID=2761500 RepID=A0A836IN59_9TRYP|nr:hypothetical protein JKF63_06652 [Porcisia hertigi]